MIKYFKIVKDLQDLKDQYRKLCKIHHPDLGGDTVIMQEINNEYEARLKSGEFNAEYEKTKSSVEIETALREVIEKICVFKKIAIEICGRWLWFSGETWRYKKILKEIGCRWSANKSMWYFRTEDNATTYKRRKPLNIDTIRKKYGSSRVEMRESCEIA